MGTLSSLAQRAIEQKDKSFNGGNNLNPWAVYELEVLGVRSAPGFRSDGSKTTWCTPEFKVISMTPTKTPDELKALGLPATQYPNQPGSTVALPLDEQKDWAIDVVFKFFETASLESRAELVAVKEKVGDKEKTTLDLLVSDMQPLKGCRLMCETYEKPLRGKPAERLYMRTRTKFSHTPETEAICRKVLGA